MPGAAEKIVLCVLTCNPGPGWQEWLRRMTPLQHSGSLQILVLDSQSADDTMILARSFGCAVHTIPRQAFNHGATRELARKLVDAEIVVFMTQDALPVDGQLVEKLVEPLISGRASVAYARQVPRPGADIFEAFPRRFNYPPQSELRGIEDVATYGVYTFFCSDSCAAYSNAALDEIGGFRPALVSEDYLAAARLLQQGHRIAYVAEAVVEHSHSYTLREEFRRYFDTGYVRAENPWVQELAGQAEGRGRAYFRALCRELWASTPWLLPYALLNSAIKWLGYRIGFCSLHAPQWWKKALSGQKYYWDSGCREPRNPSDRPQRF